LAKYSFLTFLAHGPILLASWVVYQKLFAAAVPYWIYWVVTPVIIAVFIIGIHMLGYKIMPWVMNIVTGGRQAKPATPSSDAPAKSIYETTESRIARRKKGLKFGRSNAKK